MCFFPHFFALGECSLGAHGLLRFRTNDVLLGTSGVGVCVSVVSNSLGMLYRVRMATSLSPAAISCWILFRKRKVASSKPAGPLYYYFFSPERAQFCSRCLLDSIQRSQAVAWCVFRFRHGSGAAQSGWQKGGEDVAEGWGVGGRWVGTYCAAGL